MAVLIGGLQNAGYTLQGPDFPSGLVGVMQGIILFCALGGELPDPLPAALDPNACGEARGGAGVMSTARLRLAVAGETMFPPRAPFFPKTWGTFRFPTPLPAHEPETDS